MGRINGLITPLIADSFRVESANWTKPVSGKTHVRIMPDGEINQASAAVLAKNGFVPDKITNIRVTPDNIHLAKAMEKDATIRSMIMRARHKQIVKAGQQILSDSTVLQVRHD